MVAEIRALRRQGLSVRAIATKTKQSRSVVSWRNTARHERALQRPRDRPGATCP